MERDRGLICPPRHRSAFPRELRRRNDRGRFNSSSASDASVDQADARNGDTGFRDRPILGSQTRETRPFRVFSPFGVFAHTPSHTPTPDAIVRFGSEKKYPPANPLAVSCVATMGKGRRRSARGKAEASVGRSGRLGDELGRRQRRGHPSPGSLEPERPMGPVPGAAAPTVGVTPGIPPRHRPGYAEVGAGKVG